MGSFESVSFSNVTFGNVVSAIESNDCTSNCPHVSSVHDVFRSVSSSYFQKVLAHTTPYEAKVLQVHHSTFTFAEDGIEFVSQDVHIKQIINELELWDQIPKSLRVKTRHEDLERRMRTPMRAFLNKVFPKDVLASNHWSLEFRLLPARNGGSAHQNDKAELHKDFQQFPLRIWLPKRRLEGGLIVSPRTDFRKQAAIQLFGGSVNVGDAWLFASDIYHGAAPWDDVGESQDRGYFATVSLWPLGTVPTQQSDLEVRPNPSIALLSI